MVSISKVLQVLTRRFEVAQPQFTPSDARKVLFFLSGLPISELKRGDALHIASIIAHCPHILTVLEHEKRLPEKLMLCFFLSGCSDDADMLEATRRSIYVLSSVPSLHINLMMTMSRRVAVYKRSGHSPVKCLSERDDDVANGLLRRVTDYMTPPPDGYLSDGGMHHAFLKQKELHKRRKNLFEKPELLYFTSTLRYVASQRQHRHHDSLIAAAAGGAATPPSSEHHFLPDDVVDCFTRFILSLHVFGNAEAPMRRDDWLIIANIVACPDERLRKMGIRLWTMKAAHYDPVEMNADDTTQLFARTLSGFLLNVRGAMRGDVMKMWVGVVTHPRILPMVDEKVLQMVLFEFTQHVQRDDNDNATVEQIHSASMSILSAWEGSSSLVPYLDARILLTQTTPLLSTAEELNKTLVVLKDVLASDEELKDPLLRNIAEFIRHFPRKFEVDRQTYLEVLQLFLKKVSCVLQLPTYVERRSVHLPSFLTTVAFALREVQADTASLPSKDELYINLKQLCLALMDSSSPANVNVTSLHLQIMDLLDFASETQYTTSIRERVLTVFRGAPAGKDEVTLFTAHSCYELLICSLHFHILDEEVLTTALTALRYCTDVKTVLERLSWPQRRQLLERGASLYREISPMMASSRGARRLAKHLLTVASSLASDKHASQVSEDKRQTGIHRPLSNVDCLQYCAQAMWLLVVRVSRCPIPHVPVDRYLAVMLRFCKKHWMHRKLLLGPSLEDRVGNDTAECAPSQKTEEQPPVEVTRSDDEKFNGDLMEGLLLPLQAIVAMYFTNRVAFNANIRRHRAIISTACQIIDQNSAFLCRRTWLGVVRVLSVILSVQPNHCTALLMDVLKRAVEETLRNARDCGNRGNWHIPKKARLEGQEENMGPVLGGRNVADIISCFHLIEDAELKVYAISLALEHIEKLNPNSTVKDVPLIPEEKSRLICFNKVITCVRNGSILY
uniref:Uncharacterized protein n=1 Tax=Trypanosoma congolense (strain IL3000) TaxID=1068625 RepID=G0UXB2_TRYCI|nr:conserved hypothetical protein [Trypanosoma congolense IL3000]